METAAKRELGGNGDEWNGDRQFPMASMWSTWPTLLHYPPDLQEAATKLVLRQAKLMADGVAEGL